MGWRKVALMSNAVNRVGSVVLFFAVCHFIAIFPARADDLPIIEKVSAQPLVAQVTQVQEALEYLGSPLPDSVKAKLEDAFKAPDESSRVRAIQEALDPYCLIANPINPESRVKAQLGPAAPR